MTLPRTHPGITRSRCPLAHLTVHRLATSPTHRQLYSSIGPCRSFNAQSSAQAASTRSWAPVARSLRAPTPMTVVMRIAVLPSR